MTKILKFGSETCGPCKLMAKRLQNIDMDVTDIDIYEDENEELVKKYDIRSIPTLVMLGSNGKELGKLVGVKTEKDIKDWADQFEEWRKITYEVNFYTHDSMLKFLRKGFKLPNNFLETGDKIGQQCKMGDSTSTFTLVGLQMTNEDFYYILQDTEGSKSIHSCLTGINFINA